MFGKEIEKAESKRYNAMFPTIGPNMYSAHRQAPSDVPEDQAMISPSKVDYQYDSDAEDKKKVENERRRKSREYHAIKAKADEKEMSVEQYQETFLSRSHRIQMSNEAALFMISLITEQTESRIFDICKFVDEFKIAHDNGKIRGIKDGRLVSRRMKRDTDWTAIFK